MALCERILGSASLALSVTLDDDPTFRLDLPPVGGPGTAGVIREETLAGMAALYLFAELEMAAIVAVAEVLAEERYALGLRNAEAAQRLEDYEQRAEAERWLETRRREQLFARMFGLGPLAATLEGANRGFETRFAALCDSIVSLGEALRWSRGVPAMQESGLRHAASQLFVDLGRWHTPDPRVTAQRIQRQLQWSVDLLNHEGIRQFFRARSMWQVIDTIVGESVPFSRHVDRGQSGMAVMMWLAALAPNLGDRGVPLPIDSDDPAFAPAAVWLQASGFAMGGGGRPTSDPPGLGVFR